MLRSLKGSALSWFGMIGGAITLYGNASTLLDLANWVHWIVVHWQEWMHVFWRWSFAWTGLDIDPPYAAQFSFAFFMDSIFAGSFVYMRKLHRTRAKHTNEAPQWERLLRTALVPCLMFLFVLIMLHNYLIAFEHRFPYIRMRVEYIRYFGGLEFSHMAYLVLTGGIDHSNMVDLMVAVAYLPSACFFIACHGQEWYDFYLKVVLSRMWSVLGVFAVIAALNELSKLGMDISPPSMPL